MDFIIIHKGEGKFDAIMEDGEIKEVGPNMRGMIRYTFFEDYTMPPIGWETTRLKLLEAYQPKVLKDIMDGKIKPGNHEFGETDYIKLI